MCGILRGCGGWKLKFLPLRKSNLQTTMVHDKKIPPPNGPLSALPVLAARAENSLLMIKFPPLRKSNLQTTMVQDKKIPRSKWTLICSPSFSSILMSLLNFCSSIIFCPSHLVTEKLCMAIFDLWSHFPGHFRWISEKSAGHKITAYTKWIHCLSFTHFSEGVSELREIEFDSFQNNAHSKRWSVLHVATLSSFRTQSFVKSAVRSFHVLLWFRAQEKPSLKILK